MWLPGHIAVSFLALPSAAGAGQAGALDWRLYYVALFALLPDFIHLGDLRLYSHSLLGLSIMLALALGALYAIFRPRRIMLVIAAVAAYGRSAGRTLYIGSVSPFYPFSSTWYQLHMFNSPFDIQAELVLTFIALAAVAAFGLPRLFRSRWDLTSKESANLYVLAFFFGIMTLLQGGYFAYMLMLGGIETSRVLLLLCFLLPFAFTGALLLRMTLPAPRGSPDLRR